MENSIKAFNEQVEGFEDMQNTPWGKIRYRVSLANVDRHLPAGQRLQVLDVGGGNGVDAVNLARQGHRVRIVDPAPKMLASARLRAEQEGLVGSLAFIQAYISELADLFQAEFDLVICHNVLQYVPDLQEALAQLYAVLNPGGLLSVMSVNRFSEVYRLALQREDPAGALAALNATELKATVFSTTMRLCSAEEMSTHLEEAGFDTLDHYGVRCIGDYIFNNEIKYEPDFFADLEQLELALADQHPYRLSARFYQLIARK